MIGLVALLLPVVHADAANLDQQRRTFLEAYAKARAGQASVVDTYRARLEDYILFPDLEATSLRARVGKVPDTRIAEFLESYPYQSTSRRLRHRWATSLAKRKRWQDYLGIYQAHYADADDTVLDCYALRARLNLRQTHGLSQDSMDVWLVGKSQPDECDPVFAWLRESGDLTPRMLRKRLNLALDAGKLDLARYLARSLDKHDRRLVESWARMRRDPRAALRNAARLKDNESNRRLVAHGVDRWSRRDALAARDGLQALETSFAFETDTLQKLKRNIGLRAARKGEAEALDVLLSLNSPDTTASAWAVRSALRHADWNGVTRALDTFDTQSQTEPTWQYWRARAAEARGDTDLARTLYLKVAATRDFYGFMAADQLGLDYAYAHEPNAPDETVIARLSQHPDLLHARELFEVGLHGPARSEWDAASRQLDRNEKAQASIVAQRWGWPSRAIKTAVNSPARNDLINRYPTPFKDTFDEHTRKQDISRTWAYGIAHSESLFMPDVRSSAGAIGIMQLMPATGKEEARRAKLRYRGAMMLTEPSVNIRLGTNHLARMYRRFDEHQVLATAAYNAGARRVKSWLPQDNALAADVWVETIPFTETRRYVKRVLAAQSIFHWRLTGEQLRLAGVMRAIPSANRNASRVASKSGGK